MGAFGSKTEKAYERYAWTLVFVSATVAFALNLLGLVAGPSIDPDLQPVAGVTWAQLASADPRLSSWIDFNYRGSGLAGAVASFFVMAISVKSYRRSERWSWHALWAVPVLLGLYAALLFADGAASWPIYIPFFTVSALGLLLPYRKFFPRKQH